MNDLKQIVEHAATLNRDRNIMAERRRLLAKALQENRISEEDIQGKNVRQDAHHRQSRSDGITELHT